MTQTLAQKKAVKPATTIALTATPSQREILNPANASTIKLQNESTSSLIVQGMGATLNIEIDAGNFTQGQAEFTLVAASLVSTALNIKFIGTDGTVLCTIAKTVIAASPLATVLRPVIKPDNKILLMSTDANDAGVSTGFFNLASGGDTDTSGFVLTNATYVDGVLHYTSGLLIGDNSGMSAYTPTTTGDKFKFTLPNNPAIIVSGIEISPRTHPTDLTIDAVIINWSAQAGLTANTLVNEVAGSPYIPTNAYIEGDVVSGQLDLTNHTLICEVHRGTTLIDQFSLIAPSFITPVNLMVVVLVNAPDATANLQLSFVPSL